MTGQIFYEHNPERLGGRMLVPTYIFKAIYDPRQDAAAAYVARNTPGPRYVVVSIEEIDELSGLSVFPDLPENVRILHLPKPYIRETKPLHIVP